ncbi:MAG: hypothetical protein RLO46_09535, partial [Pseudomonadales bacterium]
MSQAFRLSRLKAPRGTVTAMVLLAVVLLGFGAAMSVAEPALPAHTGSAPSLSVLNLAHWLLDACRRSAHARKRTGPRSPPVHPGPASRLDRRRVRRRRPGAGYGS